MDQAISPLLNALQSEDSAVVEQATAQLEIYSRENAASLRAEAVLPLLIERMDYGPNWAVRQNICALLDGAVPRETIAYLTEKLASPEPRARRDAAARFGRITESLWPALVRETRKQAILALRQAAVSEEWSIRAQIFQVLGRLRVRAALPVFIAALDDENDWVRGDALLALANLGTLSALAVPRLIRALDDTTNNHYAARALGQIGVAADSAIPHLERARKRAEETGDDELCEEAENALTRITRLRKRQADRLEKKTSRENS